MPLSRACAHCIVPWNCFWTTSTRISWLLLWYAQQISLQLIFTSVALPLRSACCRKNNMNRAALSSMERLCFSTIDTHSTMSARWICSCRESWGRATCVSFSLIARATSSVTVSISSSSSVKLLKAVFPALLPAADPAVDYKN